MRAAVMYGAGDVRIEDRPDPKIVNPTDAIVRTVASCVCGSDLWPYKSMPATDTGRPMGHEFLGVVEEIGADVTHVRAGDLVVAPFTYCDNTCDYCAKGLQSSCRHGGRYGYDGVDGGQGEAVRVPQADGTLVKLPVEPDSELLPSLLALSDVMGTGHHGAVTAGVRPGDSVLVIGDGAVGLSAVIAAKRLGAEQIVLMGRHTDRTDLGREFGATDVVAERGEEGIARVRDLTGGDGVDRIVEAVGTRQSLEAAFGTITDGGTISRLGVPQYEEGPVGASMIMRNITLTGGVSPARAYIEELMPDVLSGAIRPGRVFDRTITLDEVPRAYQDMTDRRVLKALIRF
ncbi:zinc-dependent alcohol dehydrogenase family protein [Streptomyces turgidiscabies]|uniref:Oxidoreductase, zinc-binding dehydrogenase family protein n=1 Tax=Streptomyces turgidiscabies (strain Car8) TaxID=698760 RepID=L7EUQ7_STRT8|nr:zinc-dependent alcohol dehydrogenase family protein [Streptomyces turgidiscabies]ELP63133.1 oxidoreductase, zinc-binding dehydrogenase family protein [Streptomyces turgidiscabies Car8]MDX3496609.1 zinc-dependent alcohol dehydrogenase family protein [Streptomyces turgidiscabies]GAQ72806.1 NADP-dependent isopropanol dehydrogenase [Streptomyces turgidiscabies]